MNPAVQNGIDVTMYHGAVALLDSMLYVDRFHGRLFDAGGLAQADSQCSRRQSQQKFCKKLANNLQTFANFANFWRARSRLYRNQILRVEYAFDSIFQALQDLHTFAPLQSQNVFLQAQHFS